MPQYGSAPGYSYGELTIENIKEAFLRHFTRQFKLSKNVACNVLAICGMYPVDLSETKDLLPLFSTRISLFQSFGVQMVHYIMHKTSWYIKLIQLSDFLMHGFVSELLPRASKFSFHCPSYIIHSNVLVIVKKIDNLSLLSSVRILQA